MDVYIRVVKYLFNIVNIQIIQILIINELNLFERSLIITKL